MLEGVGIRRHTVGRGDRADGADMHIGSVVAHHADGAHGEQHGEGLPDLVIEAGFPDFIEIGRFIVLGRLEMLFNRFPYFATSINSMPFIRSRLTSALTVVPWAVARAER